MIKDDIQKAIIDNLRAGNQTELNTLRFILSEINYGQIAKQKELTDEEIVTLLQREVKKRKEAIVLFDRGNRQDLVAEEKRQLEVIDKYLPAQLSSTELEKIVDQVLTEVTDKSNAGKIIGSVMAKAKGRAEGSVVAQLVKEKLSSS